MNNIVTRADARTAGLVRFFTGVPCKFGHIAERLTNGGCCTECGRIKSNALYAARADEMNAKRKAAYLKSPDAARLRAAAWREANPEKYKEQMRQHYLANKASSI